MELPPEIEDAIACAPDEREAYAVAGDWLQQQGDPQGELVAFGLAPTEPEIADRMIQLRQQLAPVDVGEHSPITLEWRWGFVRGALIRGGDPAMLRRLLEAPVARFLQKLVIEDATPRLVEAIAARRLRCVRTLIVLANDHAGAIAVEPLCKALPSLERLGLRGLRAPGRLELPRLRELSLSHIAEVAPVVAASALPVLERLELGPAELPPPDDWLVPEYVPALRSLTLTTPLRVLAGPWQASRIGAQLTQLDNFVLRQGALTLRTLLVDRSPASSTAALLVVVGRRVPGTLIPISSPFRIGRLPEQQLVLTDKDVRPEHAELYDLRRWQIRTLADDALVHVEGHQVETSPLRDNDELAVGSHVFRFLEGNIEASARQLRLRFGF